jgi:hypothetical protein
MKQLRLVRVTEHNGATMGVLCIDDVPEFVTLEDAWRDNERQISCIPVGRYTIKPKISPKFGNTWEVMNVPERSQILFHAGNTHKDTHGCILLGLQFGKLGNETAILASRSAFLQFLQKMADVKESELLVIDAYGGGRVH